MKPKYFQRMPGGGYYTPVFSVERLRQLSKIIPFSGEDDRTYALALIILRLCFGEDWLEKHILSEPQDGYFARQLADINGSARVMQRVRRAAELVFNLAGSIGVEAPFDQIANGEIESGISELEVGKLLKKSGIRFRYIWPSGVKGESYDLEIMLENGYIVFCDTKCKIENRLFSKKGIQNSLKEASSRNLPRGYPCAIFLKVPHEWVAEQEIFSQIENEIWRFLGRTRRIVCVQLFSVIVDAKDNILMERDWGWEYVK
ncbi:hypothetical protein [Novosphingobium sp.]|uniref:hypothetical protein n=1 Tax=Novosphingobium sp. TaxID=1874826 RepID=UPI002612157E|nr:hypothetical protein [Novosphingobium sp.]